MESGPQCFVNVKVLDDVFILDVCGVANFKIKIIMNSGIDEEGNKFFREWIETCWRAGIQGAGLNIKRRTGNSRLRRTDGKWSWIRTETWINVVCFRCRRANLRVKIVLLGFGRLGGRRHGPTIPEKETRTDLFRSHRTCAPVWNRPS